jgi:hypothetical protein
MILMTRANKRLHPTPLRVDKIAAILAFKCARTTPRSSGAARVKRSPLGAPQLARKMQPMNAS